MSILVGGMWSIYCHMVLVLAFMHLYSIFILRLFLSILFYKFFNVVLKRQTETVAVPKGLTFGLCLYVLHL